MTNATFRTEFTGKVSGGPCPVCLRSGDLLAHFGTYDPGGQRTIVHKDAETGGVSGCTLPMADGWLWSGPGPVWTYKPNDTLMDER